MIEAFRNGVAFGSRALDFFTRSVEGMHKAAYILGAAALLSSLLALLRDRLLAHTFGAGSELDLYYAAFRIPDLLFVATGALVSAYVLIPEMKKRGEGEEEKHYIDAVAGGFSFLAVLSSMLLIIFAPHILTLLYPTLAEGASFSFLVLLTRIMLLQPVLLGISNICAAVTQARARFTLYATSPLVYNAGIIVGIIILYPLWGLSGLAWGVVLGALLHLFVQLPFVLREGFFRRLPSAHDISVLFSTAAVSVPRALALSFNQIALIGLTALAAMLASGSIAVFTFAHNLYSVPLAIIGASYSVAAFPVLADRFARGEMRDFVLQVGTAARHILFWSLPAIALVIVLRAHIVRVVLGTGSFDWTDTRLTAAALALFAISLAAQGLTLLVVRGYYAAGRTFVPLLVSGVSAIATVLLGAITLGVFRVPFLTPFLEELFRVEGLVGSDILALAFAYSLASLGAVCFLIYHFDKTFGGLLADIRGTFREALLAMLAAGLAAYSALNLLGPIAFSSTLASVFTRGFIAGVVGILAAMIAYWLMKSVEYQEIVSALHARFQRPTPVVSSAEETER